MGTKVKKVHQILGDGNLGDPLGDGYELNCRGWLPQEGLTLQVTWNVEEVTCKKCLADMNLSSINVVEEAEKVVADIDNDIPASFDIWFDWSKEVYSWTALAKNSEGVQVGEAVIEYYKSNIMQEVLRMRNEVDENLPILVLTAGHTKTSPVYETAIEGATRTKFPYMDV